MAVLLFHLQVNGFQNGFLGVDAFFVLSGFLMAVLYNPAQKKLFFQRRLRRLIPAYLVTVFACMLIAVVLTTPNELPSVRWQAISALLLGPNIWFWSENSYFSKAAFTPLLHLWSLGVEFQFYLIIPVLHWLFRKARILLPLGMIASLTLCFMAVEISPKTAFFMMPFRLWEFLSGYAVAVYLTDRGAVKNTHLRWIGSVGLIGLLLLPLAPLSPEAQNFAVGHPGLAALACVLGTSLILAFGFPKVLEQNKLATVLEWLGRYSYALYLVHFPVIVFMLYQPFEGTILQSSGPGQTALLVLTITLLTLALHHAVEETGRNASNLVRWLAIPVLALGVLIAAGSSMQNMRFSQEEHLIFGAWYDRSEYRCGKVVRLLNPWAVSCDLTPSIHKPEQAVLLVGNSHADSIKAAFTEVAAGMKTKVYFIVQNMPLMKGGLFPEQVVAEAVRRNAGMIVLHYSPGSVELEKIKEITSLSTKKKIWTAYIAPVPVWESHIPKALWLHARFQSDLPAQALPEYRGKNKEFLDQISSSAPKGLKVFEIAHLFCNPQCALMSLEGRPLYFDQSHLTLTGAARMKDLFREIIEFSYR